MGLENGENEAFVQLPYLKLLRKCGFGLLIRKYSQAFLHAKEFLFYPEGIVFFLNNSFAGPIVCDLETAVSFKGSSFRQELD